MGATDWLNVPKKRHREAVKSVEQALAESVVAPDIPISLESSIPSSTFEHLTPEIRSVAASSGQGIQTAPSDNINFRVYNSHAGIEVDCSLRCQMTDGSIKQIFLAVNPTSLRAKNEYQVALPDGVAAILGITASTPTVNVRRGECFVSARLMNSGAVVSQASTSSSIVTGSSNVVQALLQGYIASDNVLQYPGGVIEDSFSGHGFIKTITLADPAPGVDWVMGIPTGAIWRICQLTSVFNASAAAVNRFPGIAIQDNNSATVYFNQTGTAVTANQILRINIGNGMSFSHSAIVGFQDFENMPLPDQFFLFGNPVTIPGAFSPGPRSSTSGFQAGDTWTQIRAIIEEWVLVL